MSRRFPAANRAPGTRAPDTSAPVVVLGAKYGGLGVARTLGRLGVRVYGIHTDRSAGLRSRYWTRTFVWDFERETRDRSLGLLRDLARDVGGRPVLMATSDVTAAFIEDAAAALHADYRFPCQQPGLIAALTNKERMSELANAHGIPTPSLAVPRSRAEAAAIVERMVFPIVLKAADPTGPRGRMKIVAATAREVLERYDEAARVGPANIVLQEYIPGDDATGWTFYGCFGERSECLAGVTARKIRLSPPRTGVISLGVVDEILAAQEMCRRFMAGVGYRGVVNIGGKFDHRDGLYKVLDVNARLGASFRLCAAEHGMDVVRALYLNLTGQPVPDARPLVGRKWMVEEDLFSAVAYARAGDLTLGRWLRSLQGVREFAWWAADDPVPGLSWCAERIVAPLWARRQRGRRLPARAV